MNVQPGETLDRYRVERVLGEGGMATVWKVQHQQLRTMHAMKVLRAAWGATSERLLLEGRVQARLHHPNIVTVTDVVEVFGSPGLVMEFVAGPTLEALMEDSRLSLEEADVLVRGILSGVAAAHAEGLIHRDLKPSNVLLAFTRGGISPKVADFGIARALGSENASDARQTRTGFAMGTPGYMAPEQIRDAKNVDARADIFALGCICYEMVTGRPPFSGKDTFDLFTAVCAGRFAPPASLRPDLPERMERAILGALEVEPEDRIANCDVMLECWTGGVALSKHAARGVELTGLYARCERLAARVEAASVGQTLVGAGNDGLEVSGQTIAPEGTALPALNLGEAHVAVPTRAGPEQPTLAPPTTPPVRRVDPAASSGKLWLAGAFALVGLASFGGTVLWALPRISGAAPPQLSNETTGTIVATQVPVEVQPISATEAVVDDSKSLSPSPEAALQSLPSPSAGPARGEEEAPKRTDVSRPAPIDSPPPSSASGASDTKPTSPADGRATSVAAGSADTDAAGTAASPAAVPAPGPADAPFAAAAPAETLPVTGKVVLSGDAKSVWLQSAAGNVRPGNVPPGTYRIKVFFEGVEPRTVGELTVVAGQTTTLHCQKVLSDCKVQ